MNCFDVCCIPCILLFRFATWICPCLFNTRLTTSDPFDVQLQSNRCTEGGWYTDYYATRVCTRESFYTLLALRLRRKGHLYVKRFVERLAGSMTADGQIPSGFTYSWMSHAPVYASFQTRQLTVDANMFFILMVWWCHDKYPDTVRKYYLHCQRAMHWLETFAHNRTVYEPIGASWEYTRQHDGVMLLTNTLMVQTVRSMELIACVMKDDRVQKQYEIEHGHWLDKWQVEIYKTQETLPRILALYWNMVPGNFIQSFNQGIQQPHVPVRTAGPITAAVMMRDRLYGRGDLHTEVVWPWIGFFWASLLASRNHMDAAQGWWTAYIEMHHSNTLYDIYDVTSGHPVRRAFLKAMPAHSLTLAMQMSANQLLTGTPAV
jgi:hypothetical protein